MYQLYYKGEIQTCKIHFNLAIICYIMLFCKSVSLYERNIGTCLTSIIVNRSHCFHSNADLYVLLTNPTDVFRVEDKLLNIFLILVREHWKFTGIFIFYRNSIQSQV